MLNQVLFFEHWLNCALKVVNANGKRGLKKSLIKKLYNRLQFDLNAWLWVNNTLFHFHCYTATEAATTRYLLATV